MTEEKEIALISGATRGIGRAIALELGRSGMVVIGTATSQTGAESISNYMSENKIEGTGMVMNVTDPSSIDAALAQINQQYGAPSVLINNAGITRDNLLMRMKEDEWNDVIDTNLASVYRLSKACLRAMLKMKRGRIVNIASVVGFSGNPGQTNYAAAKAGMVGFSRALAREVASRGITVNTVAPGYIATDMTDALPEEQQKTIIENIPLNRLGRPEDIAAAVAFLVSSAGAYITGETIHVNGGMYMV
jgi:3-oxoacyl-[acyl-carrier protein] reductase